MTRNWKTLAFTEKIYFHIFGFDLLGLGSVALDVSDLGLLALALTPLALLTSLV